MSTLTKVPSEYIHPVGRLATNKKVEGEYVNELVIRGTTDLMHDDAEIVTSEIVGGGGKHTIMLDLDVPATLVPSSTPGHSHLYIDLAMPWDDYVMVLNTLAMVGVLEPGYVDAALARKASTLRLPWVKKAPEKKDMFEW